MSNPALPSEAKSSKLWRAGLAIAALCIKLGCGTGVSNHPMPSDAAASGAAGQSGADGEGDSGGARAEAAAEPEGGALTGAAGEFSAGTAGETSEESAGAAGQLETDAGFSGSSGSPPSETGDAGAAGADAAEPLEPADPPAAGAPATASDDPLPGEPPEEEDVPGSAPPPADAPEGCDISMPFGEPHPVAGLPAISARARFTPDELVVYFVRQTAGGSWDIMVASRENRSDSFGEPEPVAAVNSSAVEFSPAVTQDQQQLYLASPMSGKYSLYRASRSSLDEDFGAPTLLSSISDNSVSYVDGGPYVLDSALYFHSTRESGGIFRAERDGEQYQAPVSIDLGFSGTAGFAVVTPDERTLYVAVPLTPPGGTQRLDMWMAIRSSTAESFSQVSSVSALNTDLNEVPSWVSPDGCRLYFDRDTVGEWLGSVVYVAERLR